jgi:methyl-accepting chemotaxis protein
MAFTSFLRRRRPDPDSASELTNPALPAVEAAAPEAPPDGDDVRGVFDMVEEDLRRMRRSIGAAADGMRSAVDTSAAEASKVAADAERLAAVVADAHSDVEAMTASFSDISSAGADISREIASAGSLAAAAQSGAAQAGNGVGELQAAIARIENVVDLIARVARQTTLLALNATIEAERAGPAGRGFAVVASEVKALSVETQRATDEINANIAALQRAAGSSITAMGEVISTIERLAPSFAAVSGAVVRQGEVIAVAAKVADRTRSAVDEAAIHADAMRTSSTSVAKGVTDVRAATDRLAGASESTASRLTSMLRQTRVGDRRAHDRFPTFVPARLTTAGNSLVTETVDVSEGGALLRKPLGETAIGVGNRATVDISGVGILDCHVVGLSVAGIHVAFDAPGAPAVAAFVEHVRGEYAERIDRCVQTAARVAHLFEQALDRGEIDESVLFDTEYEPIAGSDPAQVMTRSVPFLERALHPIQEQLLSTDSRMVFCAAVDHNGYLPVHNLVFSKPQRPGDPVWNAANSRNRRIFDDRAGLAAARNTRPFLVQAYFRDMGGGVTVLMKEVDAPITVRGRHWGGFRTAYKT